MRSEELGQYLVQLQDSEPWSIYAAWLRELIEDARNDLEFARNATKRDVARVRGILEALRMMVEFPVVVAGVVRNRMEEASHGE